MALILALGPVLSSSFFILALVEAHAHCEGRPLGHQQLRVQVQVLLVSDPGHLTPAEASVSWAVKQGHLRLSYGAPRGG